MLYTFDPVNDPEMNDHFVQKYSQFTDDQIAQIIELGDTLEQYPIKLYGQFDESHVKANKSIFPLNDDTRWVYDRMAELVLEVNKESYQYELTGFHENFYYQKYEAPSEHFNWHLDIGGQTPAPRKLSAVLQLSDESEYEGGDFDVLIATHHQRVLKSKGIVTFFPSYKIHRVTPVTKGTRRVLTMFTVGPQFR